MKTIRLPFTTVIFALFFITMVSAVPPTLPPNDQALVDEFYKRGYEIPENLVDERVNTVVHNEFDGDHAAFIRNIEVQGFTEADFRQAKRNDMIVNAMRWKLKKEAGKASSQPSASPK